LEDHEHLSLGLGDLGLGVGDLGDCRGELKDGGREVCLGLGEFGEGGVGLSGGLVDERETRRRSAGGREEVECMRSRVERRRTSADGVT